jgi:hypothetical protein
MACYMDSFTFFVLYSLCVMSFIICVALFADLFGVLFCMIWVFLCVVSYFSTINTG